MSKMAFATKLLEIVRAVVLSYIIYVLMIQAIGILYDFMTQFVYVMMKLSYVGMSYVAIKVIIDIIDDV